MLPNRQIKTAAALALALATIGPAAASARPIDGNPLHTTTTRSQTTPIVRVIAPQNGFDWGDAGIGAAGGLALSMLGLGGALVISSQRRASRHNIPAAPTS
jgi:hypothetical protein